MENVNKQLLDALKVARKKLDDEGYFPVEEIDLAIAAAEQAQRPCQYCDGTGDVHSITGEWRGVCSCEAGQAQQAEPVARDDDMVLIPRGLVGAACSAIDKKRDAQKVLALLRDVAMSKAAQPPAVADLQAELDEWRKLRDPHVLHVNLCRGFPAKLTAEQLLHIAGDEKQQQAGAVPDGYALVPIEPTEEQWGGLARDIMMAFDLGGKSPASLLANMRLRWEELPEWMRKELHDPESTAVLSKGTRAVLIYRAMLAAAPQAAAAQAPDLMAQLRALAKQHGWNFVRAKARLIEEGTKTCHKCHGSGLTHSCLCVHYDKAKEQEAMAEYRAAAQKGGA